MADGTEFTLTSDLGRIRVADDLATFSGNVRIATTSGFVVRTEVLNTALSGVKGNSPGMVTGTGPVGEFTAGRMQITTINGNGPVHMVFKDGVKLIYDPKQTEN